MIFFSVKEGDAAWQFWKVAVDGPLGSPVLLRAMSRGNRQGPPIDTASLAPLEGKPRSRASTTARTCFSP